jgi:hypothetical protein
MLLINLKILYKQIIPVLPTKNSENEYFDDKRLAKIY